MLRKIKATPKKKQNTPAGHQIKSFPVVGIGGSAGGLEAFQKLLTNISDKPGMALVFIMHLAPGHKSLLSELLARKTKMPVSEITNGMVPEINHVYIKPSNTNLSMARGKLILSVVENDKVQRMPIDYFFRSLADELGNRSIGVILSGTATDGTLGAGAIKAAGGITFAEDENSAAFNDMPKSAIAAGYVDFVLSPKRIAGELERIARHPVISSAAPFKTDKPIIPEGKGFESIFDILRRAKGLDFTHYKTATMARRISRRVVLTKQGNLKNYIKFLREDKDETGYLYEDLLINVTNFFRDPKAFHALEKLAIPKILKNTTKDQGIRIWVPGCSSGEEAYSIAILLTEALGRNAGVVPVNIFATDMSEVGINKARHGVYGLNITDAVSPRRLKMFFTKEGNCYKISKSLRGVCVFSKQNVFNDPPFSNIDLVSCRNLLIYFQPMLQKKIFHNFHYSLRPNGFLFLGNSESAAGYANLFKDLDIKQKIFVKKYVSIRPGLELGQKYYPAKKLEVKEKIVIKTGKETDITDIADRIVLNEYAPCGVLLDSSMGIVRFRGHTGRFLESASGRPCLDIFKLAREGLLLPLRSAIHKARKTKHTVKKEASHVLCNGHKISVMITVIPLKSAALKEEFFLVLFDEITRAARLKNLPGARRGISLKGRSVEKNGYIKDLEKELAETKEYLQTVIEEQGNVNEELQTANEEILSSNEELQSTNEELETAKEELQSSNEELTTTNEELQNRNAEVSLLNNDLINLLGSINIPVVLMGVDFVIRRVTPQADKVLNITSSDVGRPINKVKLNIDIPDLEKTLSDVIESFHPKTFEIKDKDGNWYSVYIRPYRTMDNEINGVVAIFVDITERKKAQQVIEEARIYAENIIETMTEPLIVLDDDLRVVSANRSFYRTFKVNPKETEGQSIYDLGNRQWDIPNLRQLLENILPKETTIEGYEIEHNFKTIGQKTMLFNALRLTNMRMILITIEDITERKRTEESLKESETRFKTIFNESTDGMLLADTRTRRFFMCNPKICHMLGYTEEELTRMGVDDIHPEASLPFVIEQFEQQAKGEIKLAAELPVRRKDDSIFYADVSTSRVILAGKKYLIGSFRDVTGRKKTEEKEKELMAAQAKIVAERAKAAELKKAYDELKETQEMLLRSEKLAVLGKLAGSVSHELRNPLGVIRNSVYFLRMKLGQALEDEKIKKHLDILEEEIQISDRIINDILAFARIKEVRLAETDLNGIIEGLLKVIKISENIMITAPLNSGLPHISADEVQLKQVFSNIMLNAVQAMPNGGELTIASRTNNEIIEVDIIDTGTGISKENLERIFDPLFSTKAQGTGLGLTVCQSIIEMHSGSIEVESEIGKGSKFIVKLPINTS